MSVEGLAGDLEKLVLDKAGRQKEEIRQQIWTAMLTNNLILPSFKGQRLAQKKIPFFEGHDQAANRLKSHPTFEAAQVIKINPSLAQQPLRRHILDEMEQLLIIPSKTMTSESICLQLDGEGKSSKWRETSSYQAGGNANGKSLGFKTWPPGLFIDLVVVGSVAVSEKGVRLGKGEQLAELEWAILWRAGAVNETTVIATTVHEDQIVSEEELPASLMNAFDLPVDIIVTPRRIIEVKKKLPKPKGQIDWVYFDGTKMENIPILAELKKQDEARDDSDSD